MNSAIGPRHGGNARPRTAHRRKSAQPEQPEEKVEETAAGRLFTFTIDADTASIVKFELLDPSGARHEPSDEEKATLAHEARAGALEQVLTSAFEAGIACALGWETVEESGEGEDSDEERTLRRLLLERLIEHSELKGTLQRNVLDRLILESLIQHSIDQPPSTAGHSTGTPDRTAQTRTN
jgi:hypothetical protein